MQRTGPAHQVSLILWNDLKTALSKFTHTRTLIKKAYLYKRAMKNNDNRKNCISFDKYHDQPMHYNKRENYQMLCYKLRDISILNYKKDLLYSKSVVNI